MTNDLRIWEKIKSSLDAEKLGIDGEEWQKFVQKIDGFLSGNKESAVYKLYTDAAARGNPGPAGLGVVIEDENGRIVKEYYEFIGEQTNNAAEYMALIKGLELAEQAGAKHIDVYSDSELMSKQINGEYKVKNKALIDLYMKARDLMSRFSGAKVNHVTRNFNRKADRLANMAIDAQK